MSEAVRNAELAAVEQVLTGLAPQPAGIDRDRLLFDAGQAAARRRTWAWPCATAALTCLAAVQGVALLLRSAPPERVVVVEVGRPAADNTPAPEGTDSARSQDVDQSQACGEYLRLRDQVLCRGLDALPATPLAPPPRPPLNLEELLDLPSGTPRQAPSLSTASPRQGEKS